MKTSSWVKTPSDIRKLGGALFCVRRFDQVFMYHNGAEKKAAVFLGLTFLLSWPVAFLCFGSGMRSYTTPWLAVAVYFMFTPAISTFITQKLIYRENLMSPLRVSFRPNW